MSNILLIEDEDNLNRGIRLKLQKEGYTIFSCDGIQEGRALLVNHTIDLIICDISPINRKGLDCREFRRNSNVRIIFLTALDDEITIHMGYDTSADDYITKPFSLTVLLSKVNAIFNRLEGTQQERIESGNIILHKELMKLYVSNKEKELTKNELRLLLLFMEHPKQILSKTQILSKLFDVEGDFVDENTVAVNIRRLREKIEEDASRPIYIKNVRGLGYLWNKECHTN